MRLKKQVWIFGILAFASTTWGQFYKVVEMSGKPIYDLEYVLLEDSTLTMSQGGNIISIPVATITQIHKRDSTSSSYESFEKTGFHPIQGLIGGTVSGFAGIYVGAGVGILIGSLIGMEGEQMILPLMGGGVIGGTISALSGLFYFSTRKIGNSPNYHNLANLPFEEKYLQLELIFSDEHP